MSSSANPMYSGSSAPGDGATKQGASTDEPQTVGVGVGLGDSEGAGDSVGDGDGEAVSEVVSGDGDGVDVSEGPEVVVVGVEVVDGVDSGEGDESPVGDGLSVGSMHCSPSGGVKAVGCAQPVPGWSWGADAGAAGGSLPHPERAGVRAQAGVETRAPDSTRRSA